MRKTVSTMRKLHALNTTHIRELAIPPQRYLYFDTVVGLVWSYDPKSYAGDSICYR
jgi:hypothetical protein